MKIISFSLFLVFSLVTFSGCAVMFGSSNYNAKFKVDDNDATIVYNNSKIGKGEAETMIARKDAKNIQVIVKKDGCEDQVVNYNTAILRGWSITGTVVTWGLVGLAVDGISGAWWKPNVNEAGVSKVDHKNFIYTINYEGCENKKTAKKE